MFDRVTIIGVGLLGGSLGLAIKSRWPGCRVTGYGHRASTIELALKSGAIDQAAADVGASVKDAQLVVLCTPVSLIAEYLEQISAHVPAGAIVTDVGSTKESIVHEGERQIRSPAYFVGSHPMAGSEKRGVDAAKVDLFEHATCIVTRSPQTDRDAADKVTAFWSALGMRVISHTPADHDRLVGLVSHLPHIAAAAVARLQTPKSLQLAGKGFEDTTRVAAGDAKLWVDILLDNRKQIVPSLTRLIDELRDLENLLRVQDEDEIELWLQEAAKVRGDYVSPSKPNAG